MIINCHFYFTLSPCFATYCNETTADSNSIKSNSDQKDINFNPLIK